MTRTSRAVLKKAAQAGVITTTLATVFGVLPSPAANAAVNTLTANPSTYQAPVSSTVNVTADVTRTSDDNATFRYVVVTGPDTGQTGTCSQPAAGATTATITCAVTNNGTAGTDTVRVFGDVPGTGTSGSVDAGEKTTDATVIFYGAAAAVDITPESDTAAAGTCNAYTVTVTDAAGNRRPNTAVQLEVVPTGTNAASRTVTFCNPNAADPTANTGVSGGNGGTSTGTATTAGGAGTIQPDANTGRVTIGIYSTSTGTASVRAYVDTNASGTYNAGEPTDVSTKTFTSGGAPGSNAAADAVTTLNATPDNANVISGQPATITVTLTNASGDPVPGVTPLARVNSGSATTGVTPTCTASNNAGVSTCTYTTQASNTASRTDTITVWVNQTTGATAGPDAGEPTDTVTRTLTATPAGYTVTLTCAGALTNAPTNDSCINPLDDRNEVFTAVVTRPNPTPGGDPLPVQGVQVRFTTTNNTQAPTAFQAVISPADVVTDANGRAVSTLTAGGGLSDGDAETVTATIVGQAAGVGTQDTATKTWQARRAATLTLTPEVVTTSTRTTSEFTATVVDQFGAPRPNVNVDFYVSGRNNLTGLDFVTGTNGTAVFRYADAGPQNDVAGGNATDTVRAVAEVATEDDNDATPATTEAGELADTSTNQFIVGPVTAGVVDVNVAAAQNATCTTPTDPANDSRTVFPTGYQDDATTGTVNEGTTPSNQVCIRVTTASGTVLAGRAVTVSLQGVGTFTNAAGTATLTSPQTVTTNGDGVAILYVRSAQSGTQTITATVDEASDAAAITYSNPPVNFARNLDLDPESSTTARPAGSDIEFTARVTDVYGNPVPGVTVNFTETGAGRFGTTNSTSAVTGANGVATATLSSTSSDTGNGSVTATIASAGTQCSQNAGAGLGSSTTTTAGNCSDTSTFVLQAATQFARTVTLTPETATATSGQGATLTATVRDASGAGVAGVAVTFTESGPGGLTTTTGTTNASGVVTVLTTSAATDEGAQTVTAAIAAADTDCELAAGAPTTGAPAGQCSDSSTVTYQRASTPPPTGVSRPTIVVSPAVITARQGSTVTVTGTPGARVELHAYTRPSTTYFIARSGIIPAAGSISWVVTPPANTRLFARSCAAPLPAGQTACAATTTSDSASVVISVRSGVSLTATRGAGCTATFTGRVIPARAGQLVNIYVLRATGSLTLVGQTRVGSDGIYRYTRAFQACGQTLTFQSRTGSDINNLGGTSNTRTFTFIR